MELSVQEKSTFIRWILNAYRLRRRECVWLLNYLLSHEKIMENVVFVDEGLEYTPLGLYITDHSTTRKCRFYYQNVSSEDMDKAFHTIRLHGDEQPIYIRFDLDFDSSALLKYLDVVGDNPHMPTGNITSKRAEIFLHSSKFHYERKRLLEQIDTALEEGDKETFMDLTFILNGLNNSWDTFRKDCRLEIITDKDRFRVKDGV